MFLSHSVTSNAGLQPCGRPCQVYDQRSAWYPSQGSRGVSFHHNKTPDFIMKTALLPLTCFHIPILTVLLFYHQDVFDQLLSCLRKFPISKSIKGRRVYRMGPIVSCCIRERSVFNEVSAKTIELQQLSAYTLEVTAK